MRWRTALPLLGALFGALFASACVESGVDNAGAFDNTVTTQGAIVGGSPALAAEQSTVKLWMTGRCSGTLLAPNLVLTARHCVAQISGFAFWCDEQGQVVDTGTGTVGGYFDPPVDPELIEVRRVPVEKILVNEDATTICQSDIALLVLAEPVDDPVLSPVRLDADVSLAEPLTVTGYGIVEERDYADTLQRREVSVIALGPAAQDASGWPAVPPGFFTVSEGPCHGDSGGPAYTSSGAVVGVASSIDKLGLQFGTGTASDCLGARGTYAAVTFELELLQRGCEEASATLWLEGEADPRAHLKGFGEACSDDAECRSNVCVPDPYPDGATQCSVGCIAVPCPDEMRCAHISNRPRCVRDTPDATTPEPPSSGKRGCATASTPGGWLGIVGLLSLWVLLGFLRRAGTHGTTGRGKSSLMVTLGLDDK